ncbi:hypothetical protein BZG36_04886 [Bifiguratus adelaidae]|uniref:Uncharacterized protein n=1 Tax=Bifiguratus adelaidae TaxID=1938954 RepID=A0A261XVH9_9FUNG|nr:hypothetical protein BZG36_04886 [Bifiguratus adelaidae]
MLTTCPICQKHFSTNTPAVSSNVRRHLRNVHHTDHYSMFPPSPASSPSPPMQAKTLPFDPMGHALYTLSTAALDSSKAPLSPPHSSPSPPPKQKLPEHILAHHRRERSRFSKRTWARAHRSRLRGTPKEDVNAALTLVRMRFLNEP